VLTSSDVGVAATVATGVPLAVGVGEGVGLAGRVVLVGVGLVRVSGVADAATDAVAVGVGTDVLVCAGCAVGGTAVGGTTTVGVGLGVRVGKVAICG
jgi:hypothetical protein